MRTKETPIVLFLKELMRHRGCHSTQMAADLGVSHAAVSRWLAGRDVPSIHSCQRIAEYSDAPLQKVLSMCYHMPRLVEAGPSQWPELRVYVQQKYPYELDEDLISMIEGLIERRRKRRYKAEGEKGS